MVFNALNIAKKLINIGTPNLYESQRGTINFFPKNNKIAFYCSYCLYCFHCFLLFSLLLCIVSVVLFIVVHCKQYCVQYCLQYFQEKHHFLLKWQLVIKNARFASRPSMWVSMRVWHVLEPSIVVSISRFCWRPVEVS